LISLIREIRQAGDTHLLLSSHLLHDVEQTCDEVLILRDGRIAGIINLEEERTANRLLLEMEVIGSGVGFSAGLGAMGCECATFGASRLKVVLPPGIEIHDVYRLAARQNVRIRRLNYRRDSLEDIFLNAMGQAGAANGHL